MKKFMVIVLALVIVFSAFALSQYDSINNVYADDVKCEDGFTCYWAFHVDKPNQKDRCTHKENNQWKFYVPLQPCDVKEKDPTQTPKTVVELPTRTLQPTNTLAPPDNKSNPTATPQQEEKERKEFTSTPTATYVTGENPNQVCNWCEMAERDLSAQETMASAQSTIASEMAGGD